MTRSIRQLTSREAVLRAMALHDELGADEFLARHGFGRSYRYQLVRDGRAYDSKALAGVAFGFQHPHLGPLRFDEFSGGTSGAAHVLRRLGFEIRTVNPARTPVPRRAARGDVAVSPLLLHSPPAEELRGEHIGQRTIRLVGCVKTKRSHPAPAQDLYVSDLFKKRRAYVESAGGRWFVLSAQHGLVSPDDVLEPYDMALKDQPAQYRARWGRDVVQGLVAELGPIDGQEFEVHAGAAYVDALRQPLQAAGGRLVLPLAGLTQGQQLAWYLRRPAPRGPDLSLSEAVETALQVLRGSSAALSPLGFPWERSDLAAPGLYGWYVDDRGAQQLSAGLGAEVGAGLVYAGQAGATAWPSGTRRSSTLLSRIGGNHLRGRVSTSTWRLSLAAALRDELDLAVIDGELSSGSTARLTDWMSQHLRLIVHPVADRDRLSELEHRVLAELDPPLNLEGRPPTPVRRALSAARAEITGSRPSRAPEP